MASVRSVPETAGDALFHQLFMRDETFGAIAEELAASAPGLIRLSEIGRSQENRPIQLLTVTEFASGEREKPACFVQGCIHSQELSGAPVALDLARRLIAGHRSGGLLSKAVFYLMPRCNPDGADRMARFPGYERSSFGPDAGIANSVEHYDIDGDGLAKEIRIADPEGELCVSAVDPACLEHRRPDSKGPFYKLVPEGMLRHWDGHTVPHYPEYARVYLDWNRNWPAGWKRENKGAGNAPLCIPECKLQAEWLESLPNLRCAVALHNGYGSVMFPAPRPEDEAFFDAVGRRGAELSGYPCFCESALDLPDPAQWKLIDAQSPGNQAYRKRKGGFIEYCYDCLHIPGLTIELGTRENSAGARTEDLMHRDAPYTAPYEVVRQQRENPDLPVCFFDWQPYEHPQLGQVEIGGRCSTLFANPLPEFLARVSAGVAQFVPEFLRECVRRDGKDL